MLNADWLNILIVIGCINHSVGSKLLLIYADSLPGALYYQYSRYKAFAAFERQGVWSDRVYGVFPTQQWPNRLSLLTGVYPREHGLVANHFYSHTQKAYFLNGQQLSDRSAAWFSRHEPLFVTARKQGAAVAAFGWPLLCELTLAEPLDLCEPPDLHSDIRLELNWTKIHRVLNATVFHDLTMLHFDLFRRAAESSGLNQNVASDKTTDLVVLRSQMHRPDLNVLVVSAHGLFGVDSVQSELHIDDYIDMALINTTIGYGALQHIVPYHGMHKKVFDSYHATQTAQRSVTGARLYQTDQPQHLSKLPFSFNYSRSPEIAPLVLIADLGTYLTTRHPTKRQPLKPVNVSAHVASGYNQEYPHMLGLMLAIGPAFVERRHQSAVHLIDLHSLICHVLKIRCPSDSGSFTRIKPILRNFVNSESKGTSDSSSLHQSSALLMMMLTVICIFPLHLRS